MLKVIHGNGLPISMPLDPTAQFQPGMVAQSKIIGNDIVIGVSDGTCPLGIIDDVRAVAFTKPQIDEVVEISVEDIETDDNGLIVNSRDAIGFLENSSIVDSSFTSTIQCALNPVNGAIIIPSGTPLNFDYNEDGILDGFKVIVNYIYRIPNQPGDDTTVGSGRVTIHYARGFYATDQFDTREFYGLNASLYVGLDGKFTTKQPTVNHPAIAIVTGPPTSINSTLELLWL